MAFRGEAGEVLAGKYRVERVLGQGGMGVVVAARHVQLGELVALKFLLPSSAADAEALSRFLREAQAAARIRSEHVARVMDVGQLEDGAPYMVMEYLDGRDLSRILSERGRLDVESSVDYLAQACEALAEAHAIGIVHRDLKPANLMLVRRADGSECVKVLDFGISKMSATNTGDASLTRTSVAFGSPAYMSPEQMVSARDVDERADIWSLGTILYELLSGTVPFQAESLPSLSIKIALEREAPLESLRPDLPRGLSDVVRKCMLKRREERFANVGELVLALAPFAPPRSQESIRRAAAILKVQAPGRPAALPAFGASTATVALPAGTFDPMPTARSWTQTFGPGTGSRRGLLLTGVVVAIVAIAFTLLRALSSNDMASEATAQAASASAAARALAVPGPPAAAPSLPAPSAAPEPAPAEPVVSPSPAAVSAPVPAIAIEPPPVPAQAPPPSAASPAKKPPPTVPRPPPRRSGVYDDM